MTDLSITVNGMKFENPFLLGSGPPGTNGKVIARSYDLGWGGMVVQDVLARREQGHQHRAALRASCAAREHRRGHRLPEHRADQRPARTRTGSTSCASSRSSYPNKILIASIMEEYRKEAWQQIVREVQETGVDGFELNLSCPHGLPERKMGMAMGENPDIVEEVVGWVKEVAKIPVWAKMTPNVGDPTVPARARRCAAAPTASRRSTRSSRSSASTSRRCGRCRPSRAHSVPGGYSGQAVRPIALRQVMEIARANPGVAISGIGGIETGFDAAQFFLLGASHRAGLHRRDAAGLRDHRRAQGRAARSS